MQGFKNVWRAAIVFGIAGSAFPGCGGSTSRDSGAQGGMAASVAGANGMVGAGGSVSSLGGASAAGAAGSLGCVFNGVHQPDGAEWRFGCNICKCAGSEVSCTLQSCDGTGGSTSAMEGGSAGLGEGGSAGSSLGGSGAFGGTGGNMSGGTSGSANGGVVGSGGSSNQCTSPGSATLCVTPANGGQVLEVGAPLTLTMRASGCYSSSCTQVKSSSCNYIGSERKFAISAFMCLATEGDVCTEDCDGAPTLPCDPGITLEAGDYSITLAPYSEPKLEFHVPSKLLRPLCIALE